MSLKTLVYWTLLATVTLSSAGCTAWENHRNSKPEGPLDRVDFSGLWELEYWQGHPPSIQGVLHVSRGEKRHSYAAELIVDYNGYPVTADFKGKVVKSDGAMVLRLVGGMNEGGMYINDDAMRLRIESDNKLVGGSWPRSSIYGPNTGTNEVWFKRSVKYSQLPDFEQLHNAVALE